MLCILLIEKHLGSENIVLPKTDLRTSDTFIRGEGWAGWILSLCTLRDFVFGPCDSSFFATVLVSAVVPFVLNNDDGSTT